jgi:hypothetical protein
MWLLLFLLLAQANANPCPVPPTQTQPPSLIVQVVDPNWEPIPGAQVMVRRLGEVTQLKSYRSDTDKDGYAKFFVPSDADYDIEASLYGFKRGRVNNIHLFMASGSPTSAYVQLRLRLSGPGTTVY